MTRRRSWSAACLAVAALAVSACGSSGGSGSASPGRASAPSGGAAVGTVAPTFSTFDLSGKRVRLTDYRGSTVVINFWASWCTPCRREFPLLAQIDARPDVVVLGVVYRDTVSNAKRFMAAHGGTWPGLQDDGSIARGYRVGPGIPQTVVVGPDGVVTRRKVGEITDPSQLF